jgi:RNA polymerase sigma-70 factor, ECF subfamily
MMDLDGATDAALLAGWTAGNKSAGRRLYARHHAVVVRFFINKVGPEATDLVQETFLRVLAGAQSFRGEAAFRTWLLGIAFNVLRKHFETLRKQDERVVQGYTSVAALSHSPSMVVVRCEEHRQLIECLRRLPLELQVVLELHYWECMTNREIADALDLPIGTVQSRIRRAREQMARMLDTEALAPLETATRKIDDWAREVRLGVLGREHSS